jgi:hypothetical protein
LQWFDHWLGHFPDAKLPPSRVVSYESNSAPAAGQWMGFDHWPADVIAPRRLYPVADGTLSDTAPRTSESQYTVNPYDGPSADVMGTLPTDDSQNQATAERNVVQPNGRYASRRSTFTLPPFDKDLTVAGPVTFHVMASIDSSDTTFVSKLETVLPDGRVMPIETGYLRAQLRNSQEKAEPVPPGRPTAYLIALGETHWRFKAGEGRRKSPGHSRRRRLPTDRHDDPSWGRDGTTRSRLLCRPTGRGLTPRPPSQQDHAPQRTSKHVIRAGGACWGGFRSLCISRCRRRSTVNEGGVRMNHARPTFGDTGRPGNRPRTAVSRVVLKSQLDRQPSRIASSARVSTSPLKSRRAPQAIEGRRCRSRRSVSAAVLRSTRDRSFRSCRKQPSRPVDPPPNAMRLNRSPSLVCPIADVYTAF